MKELLGKYPASKEYLLDILHEVQNAEPRHYLTRDALCAVAHHVNVPLSEVVSTATFYSMYSLAPRGRHIVRICESPPCQLVGADTLVDLLCAELGVAVGQTTEDGAFTLETTSCLGVCGVAPAMMIDEELYGNLTKEKILGALADVRRRDAAS
ncbi:MAG: NAD(P)H-dependent oxidoreductase subunit E [Candidatus Bipolaricaulota bacterium]